MKGNNVGIYFDKGENYNISNDAIVKVIEYEAQGILEIKNCSNMKFNQESNKFENALADYRRISDTEYLNKKSGEISEYKTSEERNFESLRKSMRKLRELIKNNFSGGKNELFITLTTEDIITDAKEFKRLFKKFWRKLKKNYKSLEYIGVIELQERGALHAHLIIKDTAHNYLFIKNDEIFGLWEHGLTKTSRISKESQNNDIDEENRIHYKNLEEIFGIETVTDYMCKYKSKEELQDECNVYFKSRRVIAPEVYKEKYSELKSTLNTYMFIEEETILVKEQETNNILNKIKTEIWKKIDNKKSKDIGNKKFRIMSKVVKIFQKILKYTRAELYKLVDRVLKHSKLYNKLSKKK